MGSVEGNFFESWDSAACSQDDPALAEEGGSGCVGLVKSTFPIAGSPQQRFEVPKRNDLLQRSPATLVDSWALTREQGP